MIGMLIGIAAILLIVGVAVWAGRSGETKGKAGDSARINSGPGIGGGQGRGS